MIWLKSASSMRRSSVSWRVAVSGFAPRSLPALAAIAAGSWLTAPLGARATHRWPTAIIKKIFAGLLYLLGVRMAYGLLPG